MNARPGYKPTEIGEIPEAWQVVRMVDLITYEKGKAPPAILAESNPAVVPYLTVETLRNGHSSQWAKPTPQTVRVSNDNIIMIWDGFYSGTVFTGFSGILGSTTVKIVSRKNLVDKAFLFNYLSARFHELNSKTAGMYLKHVSKGVLESLIVGLPPVPEQQEIASVLSTVEDAIQKTDEIIEKTQRLKKGIMQHLLTNGIGHTEFKKTEIGAMPVAWEVSTVGGECELGAGGTPSRTNPDYFEGNIPWVKSTELNYDIIYSTEEKITETAIAESNAKIYPKGTLLIAMIGLEAPGTRGRCAILGIDAAFNQSCAAITSLGQIHIPFLFYYYQLLRGKILSLAAGTKRQNLNLRLIGSLNIPVPPMSEQVRIAQILSEVDDKNRAEKHRKERLVELKNGLMQVLLTGRVRVKVN